ncbi:extracellular solute-binding protein [Gorillibacterium sp. sgz500922]|uniref:extracellular solute-binding protein n=1 Tax=Gorillibacterium sp. sgz500922 TaxID=3446694 RepID=UPI003F672F04
MKLGKRKRTIAILAIVALLASAWTFYPSGRSSHGKAHATGLFTPVIDSEAKDGYDAYRAAHSTADHPEPIIRVEGESFAETEGDGFEVADGYEGLDGKALLTPDTGSVSWNVKIDRPGLYNLRIHYYPIEGKSSAVEREVRIDGALPFKSAGNILFSRLWGNRDAEIKRDDRGNDIRPRQVEKPSWQLAAFADSEGLYEEPYQFYFDGGTRRLTLKAQREPMAIDYIELYQEKPVPTYAEAKAGYEAAGLQPVKDQSILIQAEEAALKSSPTLYPLSDRSNPSVIPYHVSKIRMNVIGGVNWKLPGQWIEWTVDAPEDGLYQIALKRKQDQLRGIYATRSLTLDGEYPFEEMKRLRFDYNMGWEMEVLGGPDTPYLFHLTKGTHRIRLTVTMGDVAPLVQTIESSVLKLNEMYRKILVITSNTPDPYRDYQLEKRIPDLVDTFKRQAEIIGSVAQYLEQSTGEKSDKVSVLYTMVTQLNEMTANPDTVAKRLSSFKVNVGGLGTWILTVQQQPLTLDYLVVSSPGAKLPAAKASFFSRVKHELGGLFASYTQDYDSIGNAKKGERSVTVWVTAARDQAQALKGLIDDTFTPETNISVQLRLVPGNILLPATLAGQGPDVALQIGEDVPVNYAMRKSAADLTQFPDFQEVASRFRDSALEPYRYNGGVYALPEQQTFPMLFYRKDVLSQLGLTPPKTWQDVYNLISVLQKHNMDFWLPIENPTNNATLAPNATFAMFLYQNGGSFYQQDGKRSALDSDISMKVFKKWTQFYTSYKFPLIADFPNRFRTGEMPIGIADYTTYNSLKVMAPEIKGLWDFTVVPGTVQSDGTVSHEVASRTVGAMLLNNSQDKQTAWEFMKWWTDKETQVAYGRAMEGLLGESARYPTANIEALEELPWPVKDYKNLESQWQDVKGIPQVPGGYFTGRHLDNAFRKVVNAGENPREALSDYILYINDEIGVKRKEFNLSY